MSDSKDTGYESIQRRFLEMLEDGRHIFDAASNALLGGTSPETIRQDLFETDRRINKTEQLIRRQIVVHGTVHGASTFPSLLVMMSIAKDAERIGDYAKNIFDLAVLRPSLGTDEEQAAMVELKDDLSRILVRAKNIFEAEDEGSARSFLAECNRIENACDDGVTRLLGATDNAAGRALAHRYFKRVASHASNIVTSLVVPLDKLDFFDEP